ncbi:hypothetical protein BO94DRAFT_590502 [Aspergillus sclerotioniger CBS 115572]|uniref:Uncharacterized protein n=1 Tax=Aspergillus sclerotioniger CBS 115572 TaxID=1450535 RepID=A0A317V7F7_9EURO|nr:hypothetical protein BO94DRAFT_590502 [Aspergillus sclerotioniger CBS 115572]PWY69201.1 hypothetical protein BO94DRAFT_590502 [Aspergillus sclerotioniger CBS 115572]
MKLSLTLLAAALTATTALAAAVHNDRPLIKKDVAAAAPSGTASAVALASPSVAAAAQYGTAQVADGTDDDDKGKDDGEDDGEDEGADDGEKGDQDADKDGAASSLDFVRSPLLPD